MHWPIVLDFFEYAFGNGAELFYPMEWLSDGLFLTDNIKTIDNAQCMSFMANHSVVGFQNVTS